MEIFTQSREGCMQRVYLDPNKEPINSNIGKLGTETSRDKFAFIIGSNFDNFGNFIVVYRKL